MNPTITIEIENPFAFLVELNQVFASQWAETEGWRGTAYDPDMDYFRRMLSTGRLFAVTARTDDALVGCLVIVLGKDPLDQAEYASEMGFFLHPEHRHGNAARAMVSKAIDVLESRKVERIVFNDKQPSGGVDLKGFFEALGFSMVSRAYVRRRRS